MVSELRSVVAEKFCNYVGQSVCSKLSNPPVIGALMIGAAGIAITAAIQWRWKTSTVNQFPALTVNQFPTLSAPKLEITKLYETRYPIILGPTKNPPDLLNLAPYLLGDLRCGDGQEIPLLEGDYLIHVELNNSKAWGKQNYLLPAYLVRRLSPHLPYIIQYKNEQKILTISEGLHKSLAQTLESWENKYYAEPGAFSNEPMQVIKILPKDCGGDVGPSMSSFLQAKRYLFPPK